MGAPMGYVNRLRHSKPHMAIDATARIPAGVGLVAVVHANGHHIVTRTQIAGYLVLKGTVAVRTIAHLLAVDVDGGVHIDAVELEIIPGCLMNAEMLAIPPHPTGQRATARSAGVACREVALDSPVVGQVEASPMGVAVIYCGHRGRVSQHEPPVLVKAFPFPCLRSQCREQQHSHKQHLSHHFFHPIYSLLQRYAFFFKTTPPVLQFYSKNNKKLPMNTTHPAKNDYLCKT